MAARSLSDRGIAIAERPSIARRDCRRRYAGRISGEECRRYRRDGSEVLEPQLCQPVLLFVAHVAIGPPERDRAVEADAPFDGRELAEKGPHESVAKPREGRPKRRA